MAVHRIRRGLDVPLDGRPPNAVDRVGVVRRVALLADDYAGLRPRVHVEEGQRVRRGDSLFEDKSAPGVRYAAPAKGRISGIYRGRRRALQSVVIDLDSDELEGDTDPGALQAPLPTRTATREELVELLCQSGLWTALRARPFSRVPRPDGPPPHAIFVTAIDSHPLAPDPQLVVVPAHDDFRDGLLAVARLTEGTTYLCVAPKSRIADVDAPVQVETFAGPHPAGLAGLHIHRLAPVGRSRVVWTIGYQDVVALGRLMRTGHINPERVISIAGPAVANPRVVRTRLGASFEELTAEDDFEGEVRLISGSALSGKAMTKPHFGFLGRYDRQLTILPEHRGREALGWLVPGRRKFSLLPVFLSKWIGSKVDMTTSTHGSPRAMVPIGVYEKVMPMDILPTFLLRALLSGDLERAEALGCLELDEEDLALCSFVCPSKIDYGPHLRRTLDRLLKESQ